MIKGIYVVYDRVAETVVGGILMFPHHAAAVRFFKDVAADQGTSVAKHIGDHDLLCLGHIDEVHALVTPLPGPETVLAGAVLIAVSDTSGGNS